jgi:hypothetical protein
VRVRLCTKKLAQKVVVTKDLNQKLSRKTCEADE